MDVLFQKHCVHSYNVFDFLREVVSKVPDYGNSEAAADTSKRRKVVANELNDSDEDSKRGSMQETCHASSTGREEEEVEEEDVDGAAEAPRENPLDKRNFDLNTGLDEASDKMASTAAAVVAPTPSAGPSDVKGEEYPGLSEMDRMAIDPVHLAQLSSRLDEEDEDYDEEC
ncbi:UNVERIFIED_CONTAM: hypothetical protein Sangu_2609600 [Sesamum angustifolium]|uniref:Uncharacterized protein n=1 Tax=Sesamum angustifolium TaxID=2727405 RepID=A0AAW2J6A5_9LAMI